MAKSKAWYQNPTIQRNALRVAKALAQRAYNSYTSTSVRKTNRRSGPPIGVTTQHDRAQVYRKKYMKKGKKRQWKKFVKKVEAVNLRDRGLTTVLFNNRFDKSAGGPTSQVVGEMHLYGFKSAQAATVPGCNDLALITSNDWTNVYGVDNVYSDPITTGVNYGEVLDFKSVDNIQFESAVLDATVTNTSNATLELDVYTLMYKPYTKGVFASVEDALTNNDEYTARVQNADYGTFTNMTKIQLYNRGCTPFELGKGISMGNINILKKEKYLISPGQAITLQMRDPKNRRFNPQDFYTSGGGFKYKNWTQSFFLIGKKVLEDDSPATFRMGVSRTYKYTKEGQKTNASYFQTV